MSFLIKHFSILIYAAQMRRELSQKIFCSSLNVGLRGVDEGRKYDGLAVLSLIIESMTPKQSPHEVSPPFKTPYFLPKLSSRLLS